MQPSDELKNNPAFAGINPMKVIFLEQILKEMQKQNKDTLMPFFLAVNTKASQMGITFSDEETQLIFSEMEKRMDAEERKRFQMIQTMMRSNTASSKEKKNKKS
ncbi:MAG: hypothetical protein HFI38_03105 [Lachnospiraceae bacterium]|jgi:hypothetical protein|nr:hypothetical protein [Lachnospiraceae bacterium]